MLSLLMTGTQCVTGPEAGFFQKAQPVWPAGMEKEKNLTVLFRTEFEKPADGQAILRITGSTLYRILLNGQFAGHGPARAGHGYYRVDEWNLATQLANGKNVLTVEVAGYNVNSYYLLDQPSFVQAEVVSDGKVLAATSDQTEDFTASIVTDRVQKVPRYSFQRPFVEVYKMGQEGMRAQGHSGTGAQGKVEVEKVESKKLIARGVRYPEFVVREPVKVLGSGKVKTGVVREKYWKDRAVLNIGEKLGGFVESELAINPAINLQEMENFEFQKDSAVFVPGADLLMAADQFRIFDFGTNLTGFIGTTIHITKPGRLYLTFDEILTAGDVNFMRLGCISAVTYDLDRGDYTLESFEPYTMRFLKAILVDGEGSISRVTLREYANPDIKASFESSDPRLNRIYTAAVETFRQNAVDIFMDCPHRERAGWLCDSYFTARVANDVSGNTLIERNFLENFALPDSFAFLPAGMLPMCYPSDHNDSVFIPNWAMWFVMELKEYRHRSNDAQLVADLKPKVMDLIRYFEPFKNSDGLLEKLQSWIFVEWSAANTFVQDVNYPTNMLYAATLDAAGELYGLDSLKKQAAALREKIREQSYNGAFFVDNAIRKPDGSLEVTENTSEVCQYYAFYFGGATPELYPDLWKKLATEFGPGRKDKNPYPEVHFANSFVGNYLRLELLSRYNLRNQLLTESIDFFDYMALQTGTLWENISAYASCDHGFASHVLHMLNRDVLGIAAIDIRKKEITIQFSYLELASCKGEVPTGDAKITLEWERSGNTVNYHVGCPAGYQYVIQNPSGLILVNR